MGKLGTLLIGVVVGVAIGAFGAMQLAGGALLGSGLGTGLATGICLVVEAGKAEGLLTDEQVGTILSRAATDAGGVVPEGTDLGAEAANCKATMDKLKSGA